MRKHSTFTWRVRCTLLCESDLPHAFFYSLDPFSSVKFIVGKGFLVNVKNARISHKAIFHQ